MSETVFILGAGASHSAGAPLMGNFLDVAENISRRYDLGDDKADFTTVMQGMAALSRVHSKAAVDIHNIESVFAAFEMGKLLGRLGDLTETQIECLPHAMQRVIARTLETTITLHMSRNRIQPTASYNSLVKLITDVGEGRTITPSRNRGMGQFSVITFNYDLCFDHALSFNNVPIDYCLDSARTQGIKVLKLHGSLNWGRCVGCKKLVSRSISEMFRNKMFLQEEGQINLPLTSFMKEFQHCPPHHVEGPYVVPPTWNKTHHHIELESVWRAAADELSDAENIFVIGYSLPETDQFFRYLYALGTVGPTRLKKFWVINPDKAVEDRFKGLLGQAVESRFRFLPNKIESVLSDIRTACDLTSN
jgi:hypothetical protein